MGPGARSRTIIRARATELSVGGIGSVRAPIGGSLTFSTAARKDCNKKNDDSGGSAHEVHLDSRCSHPLVQRAWVVACRNSTLCPFRGIVGIAINGIRDPIVIAVAVIYPIAV